MDRSRQQEIEARIAQLSRALNERQAPVHTAPATPPPLPESALRELEITCIDEVEPIGVPDDEAAAVPVLVALDAPVSAVVELAAPALAAIPLASAESPWSNAGSERSVEEMFAEAEARLRSPKPPAPWFQQPIIIGLAVATALAIVLTIKVATREAPALRQSARQSAPLMQPTTVAAKPVPQPERPAAVAAPAPAPAPTRVAKNTPGRARRR